MRIAGTWNPREIDEPRRQAAFAALDAALDAGYTLFDHADIYCAGGCESLFGEWLSTRPGVRERIVIATKCGIRFSGDPHPDSPHRYDFSAEHILRSCDASLSRLQVDSIDVYQLHRPDLLMNPSEIAGAFAELKAAGKVKWFGVSNFLPSFVSALQAFLPDPLIVNQVEIHLGRLDCLIDGTLDQCLQRRITPLAWSPLGGGWLGEGRTIGWGDHQAPHRRALLVELDRIAVRIGVSRTVIALSWLLKHPSGIVPIVGSVRPEAIRDAALADEVELDRDDWYHLLTAARGRALP
jgi:predicted oxidoreductase